MKYQFIFGLSAGLLTCAATIAMGQSSALASTSDGLIPSDNVTCKPIPAKWKPGTKVKETDFYEHHPNNEKSKLDMDVYVYASSRRYELTRDLLNQHCLWLQRVGGDWYTVGGKNARNSGKFNHPKHQPLDIKEAVFVKKDEVKSKPIINFDYFEKRWHGTIEYLEKLKNDDYLVLLSYYRNAYVKQLCELRENGEFWEFLHCGRPIMRPYWKYGDTTIENLENFKPQKKMPDGSFGSSNPWGNFSVLKNKKGLPIWLTTLGPIQVFRDNTNFGGNEAQFAAKFSQHSNGVIRLWTEDGKAYHGYWARKCHGYTSYDQWWGKKNNTSVTRDYQTCWSYKDRIKKKGWSEKYTTLDGSPSWCWASITATRIPEDNTLNGVMEDCSIGVFTYKKYGFFANMVGANSPAVAKPVAIKPVAVKPASVKSESAHSGRGLAAVYAGYSYKSFPPWLHSDNKMYLFDGAKYVRWSSASDTMDSGYPKQIHGLWPGVPNDLDAAMYAGHANSEWKMKYYFFKGDQYWRWDMKHRMRSPTSTGKMSDGYPKLIKSGWPGIPNNLDAAVYGGRGDTDRNNKFLFFKGSQYWQWDIELDKLDSGYPKNIRYLWPGLPDNIDMAVYSGFSDSHRANKLYFFKDNKYWRWDNKADLLDENYPRSVAKNWPGIRETTATVKTAAVTPSTETYAFDTNWGLLTVHSDEGVTFKGTYGKKGGRVYGVYDDGDRTFRGFWDKPKAKKKCSRKKRGLIYWGKIEFQLSSNEDSFTGVWGYCDNQPSRDLSGTERLPSQAVTHCNTEDSCRAAAVAQGLQLGDAIYPFSSGSSQYESGCYAYESGTYGGRAYFGYGWSQQKMEKPLRAPKYRLCGPNKKIKQ